MNPQVKAKPDDTRERIMDVADGWARLDGGLLVETGGAGIAGLAPPFAPRPAPATAAAER